MGDLRARGAGRVDGGEECAAAFVRAIATQLGDDGERRVRALLRTAASGEDDGARTLLGDDALLAAAYSNLDLLPARCAAGDRVAAALRAALDRLPRG